MKRFLHRLFNLHMVRVLHRQPALHPRRLLLWMGRRRRRNRAVLLKGKAMEQCCDRHPSARAQARVLLPSLGELFFCGHCVRTLHFGPDFLIEYEAVAV